MAPDRSILLVSCPDATGVVAAVSGLLGRLGLNILDADQHTDPDERRFFMRVVFEGDAGGSGGGLRTELDALARERDMQTRLRRVGEPRRITILASKQTHCVADLLWRATGVGGGGGGELAATITGVISNHRDAEPLASGFGVPFCHLPVTGDDGASRASQEAAVLDEIERQGAELVVLARYMRVLSAEAVARLGPERVINIHHSFLPAFAGARPYHRAFERGVKLIGATAHYVTDELDEGPIIAQQTRRVSHRDTVEDLVRKGRDLERLVLAEAVRLHLEERVMVWGRRTVVFG